MDIESILIDLVLPVTAAGFLAGYLLCEKRSRVIIEKTEADVELYRNKCIELVALVEKQGADMRDLKKTLDRLFSGLKK